MTDSPPPIAAEARARASRPRIVMVADVRGWAFHNIALQVGARLSEEYDVRIAHLEDFDDGAQCLYEVLREHDPNVIHFFWREELFRALRMDVHGTWMHRIDAGAEQWIEKLAATAVTTSIYDHLYSDEKSLSARADLFAFIDGYTTSSERLWAMYSQSALPPPDLVVEDGVDLDRFRAGERPTDRQAPFVIGWAGNSTWRRTVDGRDPKGLHTLIRPAIEELRARRFDVVGHFADRSERCLPFEEMPGFYRELDVYVCASESEGTPNPILEAMACGVPVISTDVGIVRQVFGPQQSRFILCARTVDSLVDRLQELIESPSVRQRLSAENLAHIGSWSWQGQARKWGDFFSLILRRLDARSVLRKRSLLEGSPVVREITRMRRLAVDPRD